MLLLHGSSGVPHHDRAELFRRQGALVRAPRWFGGPGQPATACRVAVETVVAEVEVLSRACDRIVVAGTSFGAELGLLAATLEPRITAVAAFAPSAVVWGGVEDGRQHSHWTWRGREVPFAPFVEESVPGGVVPSYRDLYERSWAAAPADALIPVERIAGQVVLVAGGDDQVWPSVSFAEAIQARRADLPTTVITQPEAGHRAVLPGESAPVGGQRMARGGTPEADAELGAAAWPHVLKLLTADRTG